MASVTSTLIKTAALLLLGAAVVATTATAERRTVKRAKPAPVSKALAKPVSIAAPTIRDVAPRPRNPVNAGQAQTKPTRDKPIISNGPPTRDKPVAKGPTNTPDRPSGRQPPGNQTSDRTPPTVRPPIIVALPPIRPPVAVPLRQPPVTFIPLTPPARPPGATPPPSPPPGPSQQSQPPIGGTPPAVVALDTFVPDEVLIALPITTPETLEADVALAFNLTILERSAMTLVDQRLVRLRIPDSRAVPAVVAALQADVRVPAAQPNYIYRYQQSAPIQPAAVSTSMGAQYTLARIGLGDAQRLARGRGIVIAVIDSGVERAHPDFGGRAIDELDALDTVPRVTNATTSGLDPHGTGVAGIIAGRGLVQGVSPDVRLLSVRAFGNAQNRGSAFAITSAIVKGLNWSVENGARVVNMSFAGARDAAMERNIAALPARRVVAIAAAGNGGAAAAPAYPAAYPSVIAVTATDASDKLYDRANHGAYVAVSAPGVDVLVPAGRAEHDLQSGTSFAAPHVAGLVALMLDVNPDLSPDHVRQLLLAAVDDLGRPGRDEQYGAGRINAGKAIAAAAAFRPALAGAP